MKDTNKANASASQTRRTQAIIWLSLPCQLGVVPCLVRRLARALFEAGRVPLDQRQRPLPTPSSARIFSPSAAARARSAASVTAV